MKKLQASAGAAALIIAATALLLWQHARDKRLETENAALRDAAEQLRRENQRLAEASKTSNALSEADLRDLMRLRAQATNAPEIELENARLKAERDRLAEQLSLISSGGIQPQRTPEQQLLAVKLSFAKIWGMALIMYSDDNDGRLPTNLTDAVSYIDTNSLQPRGVPFDQFQLAYNGSLRGVENPGQMILMKEKQPGRLADGRWGKVYLFCDGHSELQTTRDGNFDAWEREHAPRDPSLPTESPLAQ